MPERPPPVTLAFVALVALTRVAELAIPAWYDALARHPGGAPWRAVTALFAYDDGWPQFLAIFLGALVLGAMAERRFGAGPWAAILVLCGLVGQSFGLIWQPEGAGSSVAVAGWLGAAMVWLAWPGSRAPAFARIGPVAVLVLAVWLTLRHDLHGPPILVGAALGAMFLARARRATSHARKA
jgi:rhomboid protease GluP